ncbi:MAG: c-type cytochrome [Burkholderiales bacterium]|nr:c-type cytochrome [Burkholderiales bacterium]
MSQSHHDPSDESGGTNRLKMAIAVTVGAFALIIGVFMLAYFAVGSHTVGKSVDSANTPEAIAKRIAPVSTLEVDESKKPAPALIPVAATSKSVAPIVAVAIPAAAVAGAPSAAGGEGVYKNACVACHGAGIAGAPKSGDKAAWSARIAQGKAMLYDHAIRGYQGKAGVMPAKGGNAALADADVKSAVDYMVSLAK